MLVHESIYETCVAEMKRRFERIRVGDPLDLNTEMGALISVSHRDKVLSFIELARKEGVEVATGGKLPAGLEGGAFLEPTLLLQPDQKSDLIQKEIFGPVLTIQSFRNDEEALAMLNDNPYGLSCSLWTASEERAKRLLPQVRTGMVWLNTWFLRNLHTAFGGMKRSGIGREGGQWSLDFYSELQTTSIPHGHWNL